MSKNNSKSGKSNKKVIKDISKDDVIVSKFKVGPKEFKKFELKDSNLRKANVTRDGFTEGLWAYFADEDLKNYDSNDSSGYAIAVCANNSLNGIPYLAYFPVEFKGSDRPVCIMENCIDFKSKVIMHDSAKEYYEKAAAANRKN